MSLRARLLGSLFLLWLAIVGLLLVFWVPTWMEEERQALERVDRQSVHILADALVEPLMTGELSTVYDVLQRVLEKNDHWRLLQLDDAFGRRLFPLEEDATPRDPEWVWIEEDLRSEHGYQGHVHLAVDYEPLLAERLAVIHQTLGGASFLALVLLLLIGWLQDRWVSRPLELISASLEAFARGDREQPPPDTEVREFRRLVESFRQMRKAILDREQDLLLHRQRLQAVLDSVQDAILVVTRDGLVMDVNPATSRLFGFEREALIGIRVDMLLPGIDLEEEGSRLTLDEGCGGEGRTMKGRRHDGQRLTMEVTVSVIAGIDEPLYCILARDVGPRLEREAHNRRLLAEVQAMIDLMPGIVLRIDGQGELEWWNDRLTRLCGLDHRRLENRSFLNLLDEADRPRARAAIEQARLEGKGEFQARLLGREAAVVHLFRLRRLDGPNPSLVLVGMDIEDQLKTQRQLLEARDRAERLARSRFYFLASASHEIRTPLNGVLGMLELLKDHVRPEGEDYLDSARRSGEQLLGLLNDILDLSKLEAGQLQLEKAPFSLQEVVDDLVELFTPQVREKGLELGWEIAPELPEAVEGDRTRLWQVLANLVSNAIKFTEQGHVLLRVRPGARPQEVVFEVEDSGIGIHPDDQARIFESFQQAASDTSRRFGGTGLGLALARQLVERMGGRLELWSQPGRGSRFTVHLPLPAAHLPKVQADRPLAGRRVLVVDDLLTNRRTLEGILRAAGATVHLAADANEALERVHFALADGEGYDAILVDADLPGMDGLALLARLAELDGLAGTRRILMVRGKDEERVQRARDLGVRQVLRKPIRRNELLSLLAEGEAVARASRARPPREERRLHGRVLLVEDNPVNLKVANAFLNRLGVEVITAGDGREAVEKWREHRPDLVLMDVQMPVMDGFQATAAIRAEEGEGRHTPIVALTANALAGDEQGCLAAGMDGYLPKPLKVERLEAELARWLGGTGEAQSASR